MLSYSREHPTHAVSDRPSHRPCVVKYAHGAYVLPGVTLQESMGVPLKFSGNSCVEQPMSYTIEQMHHGDDVASMAWRTAP